MSYNLKDVFYLGATHTYAASTYGSGGIEGNKEFLVDYKEMTWELSVADDGSYWLNA